MNQALLKVMEKYFHTFNLEKLNDSIEGQESASIHVMKCQ